MTYVGAGSSRRRRERSRRSRRGRSACVSRRPRGPPPAQIESSTRDRARICKYRHIYKRKGSPERRTNAALRGNQSGEIPTSDRKTKFGSITGTVCCATRPSLDCRPPLAAAMLVYLSLNYWSRLCSVAIIWSSAKPGALGGSPVAALPRLHRALRHAPLSHPTRTRAAFGLYLSPHDSHSAAHLLFILYY